jgi:hypothetical protein
MKSFAILSRAYDEDIKERYPLMARIWGANRLIRPFKEVEYSFDNITGGKISIPSGFESSKVKRAHKLGIRNYGHVVSKDFNINYNPFFYHSSLVRALDFLTVSLGCDMRLSEVVIADASTYEGRNAFRLLLPIARRILLVTDKKDELTEEVDYAMLRYGTSVAVIEDAVKAAERADIIVIASDNINHKYLVELDRPTLYFRFHKQPLTKWWFDNVSISYKKQGNLDFLFAQGYMDVINKKLLWNNAEKEGFNIRSIKRRDLNIIER